MSRVFRVTKRANVGVRSIKPVSLKTAHLGPLEEAKALLDRSKEEARNILTEAKAQAASMREQEMQAGYKEGYEEGYRSGLASFEGLLLEAESALALAQRSYDEMLARAEPILLALVLDVAEKVVGQSLGTQRDAALSMLKRGMEALADERQFTIHVGPEAQALFQNAAEELKGDFGAVCLQMIVDKSVGDGFVIRTPHGFVDATVRSQIKNLAQSLAETRKQLREVHGQ